MVTLKQGKDNSLEIVYK